MKNFAKYIFFVLLGVAIIDITYRLVCDDYYKHPGDNSYVKTNYTFIHCNSPYQFIILGASTAQHNFVSQQIEDSLGISTYNMGWDGRCVLYQYLSLMKAINNGKLETVVLSLSADQLSDKWVVERISDLYPYYWYSDTIRGMINEVEGKNMDILMCSSLFQYNSKIDDMLNSAKNQKGYIPLPYTGKIISGLSKKTDISTFNSIAVKYLGEMAKQCNKRGIRLIVCLTPNLGISEKEQIALVELCEKYSIETWNMVYALRDPLLFKDYSHLNEKGAVLFTSLFIDRFQSISN